MASVDRTTPSTALTGGEGSFAAPSEGRVSGYVLKLARESVARTQAQLAEVLGVGVTTVQAWESGRRPLLSMPAGNLLALQARLRRLGVPAPLQQALTLALEADLFLGQALASAPRGENPEEHVLSSWVITRPFTELAAWPLGGKTPASVAKLDRARASRRGPAPQRPVLSADERRHIVGHMQAVAERADRNAPSGLLLARQAYYLLGFDTAPETAAWLADRYRADRRLVRPGKGWTQSWPLARSTASALTRQGDPEPMRRFMADQLCDEAGERANLNYWAFWVGDLAEQQTGDAFIGSTPLTSWHGDRLLRHLMDRLHGQIGFLELNIHTLHALIQIRPDMVSAPAVAAELNTKVERLLDEGLVSSRSQRQLEALRYGIALAARNSRLTGW